jgi:hypothetical protein
MSTSPAAPISFSTAAAEPQPPPAADPAHPQHKAFQWGTFFAVLAKSLAVAAPIIAATGVHSTVLGASISGAEQVLGGFGEAFQAPQ